MSYLKSLALCAEPTPLPRVAPSPRDQPQGVLDLIGNTPLIDLSDLVKAPRVKLLGKAELANPGGSVKDRPALAMVRAAEDRGLLKGGERRILEATSGNTGIALAMIGAARGHGVTLCLPANASPERKRLLAAYGAEVVLTDPLAGSDGAILMARRRAAERPESYVYLDQYSNQENWLAHYRSTGPEILRQTGGNITHLVTGLGTSGTFRGTGRYLREQVPEIRLVAVQPEGPFHGLEGMKHMESSLVPAIYDPSLADEDWTVTTEEAYRAVKMLARRRGLLLGVSSGANVAAALRQARQMESGTVVTILCDSAEKYLSDAFWED